MFHDSSLARLGWSARHTAAIAVHSGGAPTPGRVVRVAAGLLTVATGSAVITASLPARLPGGAPEGGITVGDWLVLDGAAVRAVLPRSSVLMRRAAGTPTAAQAVAANVDVVLIAAPLGTHVSVRRIERSLAMVWSSGAMPAVVLTKADLSVDVDGDVARARAAAGAAAVVAVSAAGTGINTVRSLIPSGRTAAMIGPSGAGKSTLINALLGHDLLETAPVRADGRGRHTTSHRELVSLPGGGMLIDTPGMRELGMWDAEEGIDVVFGDIVALALSCRFADCAHRSEPGCAIREAAQTDPTIPGRLASWQKLQREQRRTDSLRDQRALMEARRGLRRQGRAYRSQLHR